MVLKVTGILFLRDLLFLVPQLLSSFLYLGGSENTSEGVWIACLSLIQIAIYGWLIVMLVLKTDWIIDKFSLDRGFAEERFDINLHRSTVLYLVFVLTGIFVIVNSLPGFCRSLFGYLQKKRLSYDQHPDPTYWITILTEIIIGLLLLGNARALVNLIELKRRK